MLSRLALCDNPNMLVEWSAECGADDPVLVVPWSAAADDPTVPHFVDLRENPYDLDHLPEAELHPPLMQALRALNANRSPVFTAKCDAWPMQAEELEHTQINLDMTPTEAPFGFASYIDLVWRERPLFVSFHQQEQRLHRLSRLLEPVDIPYAAIECILRPALVDLTGPQEGFSVSLYVKALGTDSAHAYEHWSDALGAVVTQLRGKDFTFV
jgi:hypothetical protein